MADTPELLRLCDLWIERENHDASVLARALKSRLQAEVPEDAEVAKFLSFWTREKARAVSASFEVAVDLLHRLQSRTSQAEAPTISEAHVHCPACGQHVHFTFDAPITQRARAEAPEDAEVAEIEYRHKFAIPAREALYGQEATALGGWFASAHDDRATLLAKLRARTSQAEAQAPTTAASVLTEDERESVENAREVVGLKGYECDCDAKGLVAIIDRLTVGAPAPAPTSWEPTHRHLNSGKLYELVTHSAMEVTRDTAVMSAIYRDENDQYFVQDVARFMDGRFLELGPAKGDTPETNEGEFHTMADAAARWKAGERP